MPNFRDLVSTLLVLADKGPNIFGGGFAPYSLISILSLSPSVPSVIAEEDADISR